MNNNELDADINRIARDWTTAQKKFTLTKGEIKATLRALVNKRNYRKIKKVRELNDSIGWVCYECGDKANALTCIRKYKNLPTQYSYTLSTGLLNHPCDVCGKTKNVIPSRDFFYPDFSLMTKTIKQWCTIFYKKEMKGFKSYLPNNRYVLEKEFHDFIYSNYRELVDGKNE